MKKYLLGVTAAVLLCSPFVYADDSMGQSQPMTSPSTTDTMAPAPTTMTTPTSNPTTMSNTSGDVQLKTSSGKIIHVPMSPQDLQGLNIGDKLEIIDLGNTVPAATNTNNSNNENNGISSGASTSGSTSSGASSKPVNNDTSGNINQ